MFPHRRAEIQLLSILTMEITMKFNLKTITKTFVLTVAGAAFSLLLAGATVQAGDHTSRSFDDLKWEEGAPGIYFAPLWGDWNKGPYGMVVKIEAGKAAPFHSHTHDYDGVTIQGTWVHTFGKNDERKLKPGSYTKQTGKEDHGDRCEGTVDCLILIHQHGPRDFIVSKK